MTYSAYHITPPGLNSEFKFYKILISLVMIFKLSIQRALLRNFKTGLIVNLNKKLSSLLTHSIGLLEIVKKFDAKKAKEEYPNALEQLEDFRSFYFKLEEINFFNNNGTRELVEETLSNLDSIEFHLRFLSFDNDSQNDNDKSLKDFASNLPLSTISA